MGNKPSRQENDTYNRYIHQEASQISYNHLKWLLAYFMKYPNEVIEKDRKKIYDEMIRRNNVRRKKYQDLLLKYTSSVNNDNIHLVKPEDIKEISADDNTCVICFEYAKTVMINTCRHLVICPRCALLYKDRDKSKHPLKVCPICNTEITGIVEIYRS